MIDSIELASVLGDTFINFQKDSPLAQWAVILSNLRAEGYDIVYSDAKDGKTPGQDPENPKEWPGPLDGDISVGKGPLGVSIDIKEVAALITLQQGLEGAIYELVMRYKTTPYSARELANVESDVRDVVAGILKGLYAKRGRHENTFITDERVAEIKALAQKAAKGMYG